MNTLDSIIRDLFKHLSSFILYIKYLPTLAANFAIKNLCAHCPKDPKRSTEVIPPQGDIQTDRLTPNQSRKRKNPPPPPSRKDTRGTEVSSREGRSEEGIERSQRAVHLESCFRVSRALISAPSHGDAIHKVTKLLSPMGLCDREKSPSWLCILHFSFAFA